jgi:hypothetical protein
LLDRASSRLESNDFGLRFVPLPAAICRSLVPRKGKKRATSQEGFRQTPIEYCPRTA